MDLHKQSLYEIADRLVMEYGEALDSETVLKLREIADWFRPDLLAKLEPDELGEIERGVERILRDDQ